MKFCPYYPAMSQKQSYMRSGSLYHTTVRAAAHGQPNPRSRRQDGNQACERADTYGIPWLRKRILHHNSSHFRHGQEDGKSDSRNHEAWLGGILFLISGGCFPKPWISSKLAHLDSTESSLFGFRLGSQTSPYLIGHINDTPRVNLLIPAHNAVGKPPHTRRP
ncbi:hypothetical protein L209DRAFT_477486 [Thermothelomyces heterothallicus CBS 203.75]